ncbi:MAG TPA: T9SS type A sorting domain-containing protein, partial [Saprospiraceae bacterium]
ETSPSSIRIRREWTLLNWILQEVWIFNQFFEVSFDVTEICDTKPWDTPAGDCASGHTLTDDVEWPADITVESIYYLPDDLENNPDVGTQNARPQINTKCNLASVDFQDEVTEINDTTVMVERVWAVTDSFTGEVSTYTQLIQAKKFPDGSLVCITNGEGIPIADVTLIPGINTDSTGCYAFGDPDGITVIPRKETPLEEDVNLLDIILLLEEILGQTTLTEYQRLAADMNHNFGVSTLDYVQIRKLVMGIMQDVNPRTWRFYQPLTFEQAADISNPDLPYPFVGIKTGDVDYSYYKPTPDYEDRFLKAEDEILNKGETYRIPFHLNEFGLHTGFAIRILNPNQSLEFLNVTAPDIPNFEGFPNINIQPGAINILWIGRGMDLPEGYPIYPEDTLFMLELKANENVIMNEELKIDVTYDNLISAAHGLDPYDLRFEWEDVIISSTTSLGPGRELTMYPNPVRDQVYIKGLTAADEGIMRVLDATGRLIITSSLQPMLDLSNLSDGLYYVTIIMEDGTSAVMPIYKSL